MKNRRIVGLNYIDRMYGQAQNLKVRLGEWKWKEKRWHFRGRNVCGGGDKDKNPILYIVRRRSNNVGLFSYVHTALGHIKYADEQGYIPIIDMQHYKSPYSDGKKKYNAWEYYFEQPIKCYDLEDIKHSKNVILSSGEPPREYPGYEMIKDPDIMEKWRRIHSKYIRINNESQHYIDQIKKHIWKDEKILGVLCRGTDYVRFRPKDHPIQPDIKDVISLSEEIMKKFHCQKVYLATEDISILHIFQERFKDRLIFPREITLPQWKGDKFISEIKIDRKDDHKLKGLEYLTQIVLLSECDYFIGGACGGTYEALLMTKGFEWQHIFDLGVY